MKPNVLFCSIIIVTNNSEKYLPKNIGCLRNQTRLPDEIVIVDTGSDDTDYLLQFSLDENIKIIIAEKGIGFCKGNNIGMEKINPITDYVFFLNPDAFLQETYLEGAISFMEDPKNEHCGALTGTTLGFDINADMPTGKYDTTGICQKWYGKWYDRGQGKNYDPLVFQFVESVPAICGAVFFCRKEALDTVRLRESEIFDSSFFMYKEDVDLSLRLRKRGWELMFVPQLVAYHCRGWNPNRKQASRIMRLCSARNELRIHLRQFAPIQWVYSFMKFVMVAVFDW